jgi:hypothetical protein
LGIGRIINVTPMKLSKVKVRLKDKKTVCKYDPQSPNTAFEPDYELYYTAKVGGKKTEIVLDEGRDYTCEYKNNTKPGTASVTFTAIDDSGYTGTKTQKFKIKR